MSKSRALGRLFPPINAPLPLSSRESQRLLDVMKKSFRAELDKQHDYMYSHKDAGSSSSSVASIPAPNIKHLPEEPFGPPTDRHVRAILNNPLFGVRDTLNRTPGPDIGTPYAREKLVFEAAVSKGLMNISRAHGFLIKMHTLVKERTAISVVNEEGLGSTGAGLLVLQWLRASNQPWLHDHKFSTLLLRFVIAEDLEDLVWMWIEQRIKGDQKHLSELIAAYIGAKTYLFELDPAYAAFVKIADMLEKNSVSQDYLEVARNRLNWASTVEAVQHTKPSVELFESFVTGEPTKNYLTANRVHLDLHHPTSPSSDLALEYFNSDRVWDKIIPKHIKTKRHKNPALQRIMALGLDTAQHLMHTDHRPMGMQLLNLLGTHLGTFSTEFGQGPRAAA